MANEKLGILLPGQSQLDVKTVADFWPSRLNAVALESLKSSQPEQCYFIKLCRVHRAKLAPKSLIHNFRKHNGSSLDCKPCRIFNIAKSAEAACGPSMYETAAYRAVSLLPLHLEIGAADMLIDYRCHLPILSA